MHPGTTSDAAQTGATQFSAIVTEIREFMRLHGRPVFQLTLDHTLFLPGSVAESCPLGTLTATSRTGTVLVAPITAITQDISGELWHTTVKPLQPGTRVQGYVFDHH